MNLVPDFYDEGSPLPLVHMISLFKLIWHDILVFESFWTWLKSDFTISLLLSWIKERISVMMMERKSQEKRIESFLLRLLVFL